VAASGPRYGLFAAFEGGVGSLVEALVNRLPKGTYQGDTRVSRLERNAGGWVLSFNGGKTLEADAVVLAQIGRALIRDLGLTKPMMEALATVRKANADALRGLAVEAVA
jgi:protoporphyrinogen oxidase